MFLTAVLVFSQIKALQGNIDYAMEYFLSAGGIIMHGGWCKLDWSKNEMWGLNKLDLGRKAVQMDYSHTCAEKSHRSG